MKNLIFRDIWKRLGCQSKITRMRYWKRYMETMLWFCVAQRAVAKPPKFHNSYWMIIEKKDYTVILLLPNQDVLRPHRMQNVWVANVAGIVERLLDTKYVKISDIL